MSTGRRARAPRISRSVWVSVAIVLVTLVTGYWTATKLTIASDMSLLFPSSGDAQALVRWTRAFGGRDPAVVLVRGSDPASVAEVASAVARELRAAPSIARVIDRAPAPSGPPDPTLAWLFAGPEARARLAAILTPEGMRARLAETRALLLAPADDEALQAWLARDPLRLSQVPWESKAELAPGVAAPPGGAFVADEGRARLVIAEPRGSAFVSEDAHAVVADVERAMTVAAHPGVTTELAGGHAIALGMENLLKRDFAVSGTLSLALASVAFVLTFRRLRALIAVLPPLLLGTLWTTGLAALLPYGLSAVAIAFAAVVVGVGVDTGVHVYAALLDARREGRVGTDAARAAREATWRPTLTAALIAGIAFGSLALSGLRALAQLGLLCGAGEVLTAVAILFVTPEIGARLERGAPPAVARSAFVDRILWLTATPKRARLALAGCALPLALLAVVGWPRPADALVAIRPTALAPLAVEDRIRALFGGPRRQWVVLSYDRDAREARARGDCVAEVLDRLEHDHTIEGYDSLTTFAPGEATQRARMADRDALDLPSRRRALEDALADAGFDREACAPAIDAFAHPSHDIVADPVADGDARAWLFARHVAAEGTGPGAETLVATYVRPAGGAADALAREAIALADPDAKITSFDAIDTALRDALGRDLLLVGGVALAVVAMAMRVALRSAAHTIIALATIACEMGAVGVAMRLLAVRWHVYDALVLPVLFGVTIDESMFLLHAVRLGSIDVAMRTQGPLVAATALTTAAGFAALLACRFDGLRDLGAVGAIGVLAGLVAALVIVPAAIRLGQPPSGGARGGE
jgi:predicted RND superfamily exporter protein